MSKLKINHFLIQSTYYLLLTTYSLYGEDLLYNPSFTVEEALALPIKREVAVELLWDVWKKQAPESRGKTGLVLSGGGARGFAHIGVLRHLEEIGFPVEGIVGTSMGAVVGGLYAAGLGLDKIEMMVAEAGFHEWGKMSKAHILQVVLRDGLAPNGIFESWLERAIGAKTFSDLKIPFVATATDLSSGELVLLREGLLAPALRATSTMPGFFAPVSIRQYFLVDGGLLLNVPAQAAPLLDLRNVLVVDVSQHGSDKPLTRAPSAIRALYRVIEIQGDYLVNGKSSETGDFLLKAYQPDIHTFELWRWREAYEVGLEEARAQTLSLRLAFIAKSIGQQGKDFFR